MTDIRSAYLAFIACKAPAPVLSWIMNRCVKGVDWNGSTVKDMRQHVADVAAGKDVMYGKAIDAARMKRFAKEAQRVHEQNLRRTKEAWDAFYAIDRQPPTKRVHSDE